MPAVPGSDVQALHLARAVAQVANGHAPGRVAADPGQVTRSRRRRVLARQSNELAVEPLELEGEPELRRVLPEQRADLTDRAGVEGSLDAVRRLGADAWGGVSSFHLVPGAAGRSADLREAIVGRRARGVASGPTVAIALE